MRSPRVWLALATIAAMAFTSYAFAAGGGGGYSNVRTKKRTKAKKQKRTPKKNNAIATPGAVRASKEGDIELGAPIKYHNISVVPVLTKRKGPFQRYTLLENGLKARTFEVRELDGNTDAAQVNEIEVRNKGKLPVYLLGGEMILGGKQDRIIAQDTVVASTGKWTKVSVFCVEQGRWRGQNMKFSSGNAIADTSVRRAAMSGKQSEVWSEVRKKNVLHSSQSSTDTYRRTIQNSSVREKIKPYIAQLKGKLPRDKKLAGIVFGVNGKIHVADIFGNPVLFQDLSDKLLSAYVLEALGYQVTRNAKPVSADEAEVFLQQGRKAKGKRYKKTGRSRSIDLEDDDFIGAETVDEGTGEAVRETYIRKK